MAPSSGSCGLFTQGNGRFAVTHPGNTPGEGAEPGEAPLRHKEGATRVPSEGRDAPRGASRTQGAKKASGVRGRRVRTAVRESAPQVLGTEDEKLPRQESPTTRDRTKLTKRTCRSRPLQCCPGTNRPSPKENIFPCCHSEPPFSRPQH